MRALAPSANYGGGGTLSISGTNATTSNPTNGSFDTFISFNTANMVASFNATLGPNNWIITGATLNLTENPSPGNPVFNNGTGSFQITWIANDTWIAGTGTPMAPTANGITYSQESNYFTSNLDANLGAFTFAGAAKLSCALALPAAFVTNLQAGGEVGFFMTAISPQIGFVFYSHNYGGNTADLPSLVVSATAEPGISGITVSGTNLIFSATNTVAGGTYYVLTSNNLGLPQSQWTPIATNVATSVNLMIILTNAVGLSAASPRFFMLQTY